MTRQTPKLSAVAPRGSESPRPHPAPDTPISPEEWASFGLLARSPAMQRLFEQIRRLAPTRATLLIEGESGTGKELVARAIHHLSARPGPYRVIDCGALSETLLESELFGHVRGAFTGAVQSHTGLFEATEGGTLLLDEIGDCPRSIQIRLLRALQEKEIRPVGSCTSRRLDVRVLAATDKNLDQALRDGYFLAELFYRMALIRLRIPPLRERREDIPLLAEHFIHRICRDNRLAFKQLPAALSERLIRYHWPGNVRELEHRLERAVLLSPARKIDPESLQLPAPALPGEAVQSPAEQDERGRLVQALATAQGNRTRAARLLDISRSTLYNRLKYYHLIP